ncbi:hypothetical protein CSX11_19045 [Mycobacterium goodii]|nr:hypothetical protein CSX11_19045 [Mycolicibacterium goodii]
MHGPRIGSHDEGQQPRHNRPEAAVRDGCVSSSGHGPMVVRCAGMFRLTVVPGMR